MTLLLAPEQGQLDHIDLLRHVLGALIVPRTVEDIADHLVKMEKDGTLLPSGRSHRSICDSPRTTLDELTNAGYAKTFSGFLTLSDLNHATSHDTDLLPHPDPEDKPHAPGAYAQTITRGQVWAQTSTNNPAHEHWIITKAGFTALTGQEAA